MLGTSIRVGMAKKHINSSELAEQVGVSRVTVSHWINNKATPDHKTVKKLCEFFGVPVSKFMEWGE